jgi:predicted DNA-binding ribbon-helix-helix protein
MVGLQAQSGGPATLPRNIIPIESTAGTTELFNRWPSDSLELIRMERRLQKSLNTKRSVVIGRCKTSVSLEDAFWNALKEIATIRNMPLRELLATIDSGRQPSGGLSSTIRLFVLDYYRAQID